LIWKWIQNGQVDIIKIASAYDVGKAINPDLVMTQIEGGAVHGMSAAFEGYIYDEKGRLLNNSLVDYKIATALDAPKKIIGDIVETPLDDGPWGARGGGEHVMVQKAPVWLTQLPMRLMFAYIPCRFRQKRYI
jgi:carbon-monoxide dehydrogenase large subunit